MRKTEDLFSGRNVIELAYIAGTAGTFAWTCADDWYLLYGLYEDCGLCKTNLDRISGVTFHWTAGCRFENEWINGYIRMPFGIGLNLIDLLRLTIPLFAAVLYSYRGQGYRGILKAILWMVIPTYFLIIRSRV